MKDVFCLIAIPFCLLFASCSSESARESKIREFSKTKEGQILIAKVKSERFSKAKQGAVTNDLLWSISEGKWIAQKQDGGEISIMIDRKGNAYAFETSKTGSIIAHASGKSKMSNGKIVGSLDNPSKGLSGFSSWSLEIVAGNIQSASLQGSGDTISVAKYQQF
jgi:hypothetical protein